MDATLLHFPDLETAPALAFALTMTKKYFADAGWRQPPLPEDVASIIPCTLHASSKDGEERGELIGRIQFIRPDGTVLFDQQWTIKDGFRRAG